MKKISLSFVLILLGLLGNSGCHKEWLKQPLNNVANDVNKRNGDVRWTEDFDSAMSLASTNGKLVMALFTGSDWCVYCQKLEHEVFETPQFSTWAEKNIIPLKLDYPRSVGQNPEVAEQNLKLKDRFENHVSGYPTVLFLNQKGEVVAEMGYQPGGPSNWLTKVEKLLARTGLPGSAF